MVSQTIIKALTSVQTYLVKIPGLSDEQVEQIKAIITKNTQPKIKGTGKKTGYILFSMTERKQLKEAGELEGLAFGDVARLLGKNWHESSHHNLRSIKMKFLIFCYSNHQFKSTPNHEHQQRPQNPFENWENPHRTTGCMQRM